jgi:hypothetical protein
VAKWISAMANVLYFQTTSMTFHLKHLVSVHIWLYKRWEQPLTLLVTFIIAIPFKKGHVPLRRYLRRNAVTYKLKSTLTFECFKSDVSSFLFHHTRLLGIDSEYLTLYKLQSCIVLKRRFALRE